MPLDIRVEGDATAIRATGAWLRAMEQSVHDAGTAVHGARTDSEWGWDGSAATGFRGAMGGAARAIDGLAADYQATAAALDAHADDLDTVTARMRQAVDIAREGGLRVIEDTIFEPGPPPTGPAATVTAGAAPLAYQRQVTAYHEAAEVIIAARGIESASQRALNNFLSDFVEKLPFTITDFATGLTGAVASRTVALRLRADQFEAKAARAARLLDSSYLSRRDWIRAAVLHAENVVDARSARAQATAGLLARQVDRLPGKLRSILTAGLDFERVLPTTPVIGRAQPLLKRIPAVGVGIALAGVGYDIIQGRNPVQSAVSGVGSLAAGAAVGAVIGGPVGVVVGGLVGVGVGFVVDEWGDDMARGAVAIGEAAVNVGRRAVDGVSDALGPERSPR